MGGLDWNRMEWIGAGGEMVADAKMVAQWTLEQAQACQLAMMKGPLGAKGCIEGWLLGMIGYDKQTPHQGHCW